MSAASVEPIRVTREADAARLLYERHARRVLAYCTRRLEPGDRAEDAVQQTFLRALVALRRGVVPAAEAPWLIKIAENVCCDRLRLDLRRGQHELNRDISELPDVASAPPAAARLDGVAEALASLTEAQRRALVLREWHGLSYHDIAERLELSHSAVETLLFRARRALAQRLQAQRDAVRGWVGDTASVLVALKSLFAGGAAAKVAAATIATVGVGAIALPTLVEARDQPTPAVEADVVVQRSEPMRAPVPPRLETERVRRSAPPAGKPERARAGAAVEHVSSPPARTQTQIAPTQPEPRPPTPPATSAAVPPEPPTTATPTAPAPVLALPEAPELPELPAPPSLPEPPLELPALPPVLEPVVDSLPDLPTLP